MNKHRLVYHGLASRFSTLAIDLELMRSAGFEGLEISAEKMRQVLAAGFSDQELSHRLWNVFIPGIGFLIDIERTGENEQQLFREAIEIFHLAQVAGARGVQVLTGPVNVEAVQDHAEGRVTGLYSGVLGLPRDKQIEVTAGNLRKLADLAARHGLLLYLESLAWSPLNTLQDQIELIETANRENLRLVIDYWHCYASGDTPDNVAKLDPQMIYGVHICDSLTFKGGIPNEVALRDVPTGKGVLDLRAWTDAVKATGYVGWWSCELFCRRQQQDDSFAVARELHSLMSELVLGSH